MNESEMFGLMMGDMYESDDLEKGQAEERVEEKNAGEPAKDELPTLPEERPLAEPVGDAGDAEAMGWGTEPGEASEVGARARAQFQSPPVDRRGFPDFPTFCAGYGKGCGLCRFFRMGRGPFCAVWGAAWPKFQRDAETDTATW